MNRIMRAVPLAVLSVLMIAVPSVWAYWVQDGTAICTATGNQGYPQITSDGAGGAIVTWEDGRNGSSNYDIYAQRVNALGIPQWTVGGVTLCTATLDQRFSTIVSDGAGGAIVTWMDYRSGTNYDIYAQRVNASGAVQWAANGVALCTATGTQGYPMIVSDGAGGAIVTWLDYRSGPYGDIYVQRVNASGAVQWAANGVALCTITGYKQYPQITSDGAGGAIVTWDDSRSWISYDIYAQRVNALGAVQWTADGVALCVATGDQQSPQITSDGAGGAIITWQDIRSVDWGIYAQRVNASGAVQWAANGIALCTATREQSHPTITSDGAGGAIVTWYDDRNGRGIYAQRVNASGAVQWTANGMALRTDAGLQAYPTITSDGAGGAIVTWADCRKGDFDISAQKVNASGAVQWTANGVAFCASARREDNPIITSDGAGGAIVTWEDFRSGNWDIYAQAIDSQGRVRMVAPDVLSIQDVPHDQGGWVRITIGRSLLDDVLETEHPVSTYNVWQRIDDPALVAMVAQGKSGGATVAPVKGTPLKHSVDASSVSSWPIKKLNGRYFVQSRELRAAGAFPPGTWELLGSFAAYQQNQYVYLASTVADSTASGIPYSVYVVSAHTTTPSVWFASDPDSGYSVDNIPPEVPGGLVAKQSFSPIGLALSWNVSAANDFSHYAIYRGSSEGFVPGPGNRVATPLAPEYFDGSWRWSGGYYYKVSAIDVHDNQSGSALLRPDDVTGTDTPKAPESTYLSQNYPNPFNPTTRIAFGLSAPAHVFLRIYDAAGRLVRALVNEERRAGRYEESWDARDSNGRTVASGIYFYRLNAGTFESTKKMILLR